MKKVGGMLEVGTIKATALARFGRNQRRTKLVAPNAGEPSGIFRFRTWDEFASWKKNRQRTS
jgi:hypothetical protein